MILYQKSAACLAMLTSMMLMGCGSDLEFNPSKKTSQRGLANAAQVVYCEDVQYATNSQVISDQEQWHLLPPPPTPHQNNPHSQPPTVVPNPSTRHPSSPPMTYPGYPDGCVPTTPGSPVVVVDPGTPSPQTDQWVGQRPSQRPGQQPQPPFHYPPPHQGGPLPGPNPNGDLEPFLY